MLFGQVVENAAGRRSGVVHQNIDAPKRGVSLLDKSLSIGRLGQISRYGDDFAVCLARNLGRRCFQRPLATRATSTPSRAKAKAMALPIPALAPVTSAVFPFIWR